ncbi:MAG: bifunctional folylpolyglutamate synthase/dihydrofolate synthase [Oscillospiraceae bacterium]|nr:bifunctional folylpolyglutamate synthase/dihydrofolate synthase [Oscillospiraceae bacterium]
MTGQEAINYINSKKTVVTAPGLHRIRALMDALGNPQKKYPCIHVAGTNGKGSACAMAESILRAAGYSTGLDTSPHLLRFNERIQISGVPVSDERLAEAVELVRDAAEAMEEGPNWSEIITAVTFAVFDLEKIDVAVLEVGLGGEFDPTNIIDTPAAALIMNIGYDHMEYLGSTLEEIASAKAGIIKPGGDVVIYRGEPGVEAVFERAAAARGARLHKADFDSVRPVSETIDGQVFDACGYEGLTLPLAGPHQQRNASVVITAMEILRRRGWHVSEEDIRAGLSRVVWPARFEVISHDPVFILDGGHNPQCLDAADDALRRLLPGKRVVFLVGMLRDKDVKQMVARLRTVSSEYVTITPLSDRAMKAKDLTKLIREQGGDAVTGGEIARGIELARERAGKDGVVCCIGSLYLAGAVRSIMLETDRLPSAGDAGDPS